MRFEDEEAKKDDKPAISGAEKTLYDARMILLTGEINDKQAMRVSGLLLAMAAENAKPITLIISSPGGHVESGDMIHDMIRFVSATAPVRVLGTGWVASAGALIFAAPPRERRYCLPNTRFLLHEPRGGVGGSASDVEIQAREVLRMRARLNQIFADATGQPLARIEQDTDRDYWMLAEEARAYGLVGSIIADRTGLEAS